MAHLSLKQETIEAFAAHATQQAMMIHRRVNQKKNKLLDSFPLLKKMREEIKRFDQEMTKNLGKNYTKVRNIMVGAGKFYIAGKFGGPGIIALGTINAAKAVKPLLKNAEMARREGKVSGLFDYMRKNRKEASRTLTGASLGAGAIAFGLAGMLDAKFITRAAATALIVIPEMKALKGTVDDIINGKKTTKQAFKDLGRDMLTVGISAASFIAGNYSYLLHGNGHTPVGTEAETNTGTTESGQSNGVSVGVKGADKTDSKKPHKGSKKHPHQVEHQNKSLHQVMRQKRQAAASAAQKTLLLKQQREM